MLTGRCYAPEAMLQRIMVAYDFSESAEDALGWAVDLARLVHGQVVIAHVFDAQSEDDPELAETREKLARVADDVGPEVQSRVLLGADVADALVKFSEETNADAMVIANPRFGAVARILLGNVTDAVIRSAKCPVITIPHEPE